MVKNTFFTNREAFNEELEKKVRSILINFSFSSFKDPKFKIKPYFESEISKIGMLTPMKADGPIENVLTHHVIEKVVGARLKYTGANDSPFLAPDSYDIIPNVKIDRLIGVPDYTKAYISITSTIPYDDSNIETLIHKATVGLEKILKYLDYSESSLLMIKNEKINYLINELNARRTAYDKDMETLKQI